MNSNELREQLYKMGRECRRGTWEQVQGVIHAILAVYMVRGLEYDSEQAIKSMERFNCSGVLSF